MPLEKTEGNMPAHKNLFLLNGSLATDLSLKQGGGGQGERVNERDSADGQKRWEFMAVQR
jgi:hypothetical protein